MRIMGLDLGEKGIGVAISDPFALTAQGREVLTRTSLTGDLDALQQLVESLEIEKVVVGLPRNMDGSLGPQAQKTLIFVEALAERLSIPVITYDERLSTREAQRTLIASHVGRRKRKSLVDKVAAVIILQSYLDSRMKQEVQENDRDG